ncbi:diguanylate cyclase/phosphodiesterase with PAS/PAC sensor(s) [Desulfobulbus propionicus DSM 2032]|uniref:Diguanylate cyclase/phosphodiesterase with PAS/PAC sensor(S) n=1 Tax=Desulfobulbus propionicus (strain ATCC 33891 / DSM 2032 / VKM B-1956 / 1pr3) TaxID=577650 RepID=A0A7U4DQ40_DESPD|nr:EAL domain-containing protein [Desulfobulbus propionicus]ADW18811.1 diguanylate cyclase/phosphodiesterase with PAS/PAC sensor(s) [Desulfobulbus propionicus DSM 2032]
MTLRSRIFLAYTVFFLVPLCVVFGGGGYLIASALTHREEARAQADMTVVRQLAETATQTVFTHTLRTTAENIRLVCQTLFHQHQSGRLTLDEAQRLALEALAAQRVGQQGTVLCIDSQGMLLRHPDTTRIRTRLDAAVFSRLQQLTADGYLEHQPGGQPPTALYRAAFPPWGWTILATCELGERQRMLPQILAAGTPATALPVDGRQSFLLSPSGVFWPPLFPEAAPTPEQRQALLSLAETMRRQQNGRITWTPPTALQGEEKTILFRHQPDNDLLAGVVVPSAALREPFAQFRRLALFFLLPLALVALGLAHLLARRLAAPLRQLARDLDANDQDQPPPSAADESTDELAHIVMACARLQAALEHHRRQLVEEQEACILVQRQLHQEIASRKEMEQKLLAENATRKSAENYLQLFKSIFDNAIEGIYITDPEGRILTVNQSFCKITGYQDAEVIGRNPSMLGYGDQGKAFYQGMWRNLRTMGAWSGEVWNQRKDGTVCPQWLSISVIRNDQQQITHYFAFFHDITELKRREKQISIMAYSDALTKLPNRAALERRLTKAIARASRNHLNLAVFFIDLDNFKNINDTLGHDKGDQVLIEVADRLSGTIRSEDTLSRLGGDEFILLSESIDNEQAVYTLASRILASLKQPIQLTPHTIYINASIGIALFPEDGQTTQELIKNADMAMYKAKSEGKNTFVLFTREMNEKLLNRVRTENAIRAGLKKREFSVFYQPKIDLASERPTSFEALARWHRNGVVIGPDQFIPIAEESGLIDEMSLYVLDEVCLFLGKLQGHNLRMLPISVNMSPRTFNNVQIVETIDAILGSHHIDHRLIEFEITETTAMKDVQHTLATMHRFRQRGIRFSIDDFGTGYSSLSHLSEMPVSTLKIDKRFIGADDPNSRSIVSTITAMSKQMQLKVVAEGVETSNQLQWLRQIGCNEVQGFYYSRPMPEEETLHYLQLRADSPSQDTTAVQSVTIH